MTVEMVMADPPTTNATPLPSLVIWGAGGHAKVVADIVRAGGRWRVHGFLDDLRPERDGQPLYGARLYAGPHHLEEFLAAGIRHLIVAVGDCAARLRLAEIAEHHGFTLATAVHPSAVISSTAILGPGTMVGPLAVINADSRIGSSVIVNTAAVVEHDCLLADGVHLSPRVVLGGGVSIGRSSWIGIGATVKDHVTIGSNTVVGAGAVVVRAIPDHVLAYGVPARVKENRASGSWEK